MQMQKSLQLKEKLSHLLEEQSCRGRILSSLIEERNKLLHGMSQEAVHYPANETLSHYHYIAPLVKEIHLLELKLKEQQREYEKRSLQCEAARLGQEVLADSFSEDECVLKRWSRELRELSNKTESSTEKAGSVPCSTTNVTYHATFDKQVFTEDLGVTVLCQGVHVRVLIKSEMICPNMHLSSFPTSARIGVNSDTFVPRLEENVIAAVSQGGHVSDIVSLVSQYIQEDMAPFVIMFPMKKKVGKFKGDKSKSVKSFSNNPDVDSVHHHNSDVIH